MRVTNGVDRRMACVGAFIVLDHPDPDQMQTIRRLDPFPGTVVPIRKSFIQDNPIHIMEHR